MIKLTNVSKLFGKKKVLDNITFQAKEGEIIGFLGQNGAGKTTTMRIIVGYLASSKGKVEVNGKDPIKERVEVLKDIGYLAENNPLYQDMYVLEYLNFVAAMKNTDKTADNFEECGISDVLDQKIEELSRGFKQRVGLAAALLGDPKFLILDEPTSGLDPIEQEKIRLLIKKSGKKKTIILSTHILSEVEDLATRLIIINRGRIVYDGMRPKGKGAVEKLFKRLVKHG